MKYLVLFMLSVLSAVQAGILTEEQKSRIMQIHVDCQKETGVDEALAQKARKGEYIDDPKLKKQILCFNKKAGFMNEAGDFQVDFAKSKLMEVIDDAKQADAIIGKCNIKKENAEETAFAIAQCFHNLAPTKDILE